MRCHYHNNTVNFSKFLTTGCPLTLDLKFRQISLIFPWMTFKIPDWFFHVIWFSNIYIAILLIINEVWYLFKQRAFMTDGDGLVQDCGISIAATLKIPQACKCPSKPYRTLVFYDNGPMHDCSISNTHALEILQSRTKLWRFHGNTIMATL